ncbi:hypothetical protein KY328_01795 [Candidatus Woesearchaeota archaeon]|nr:hypothetical protein [Candidatus Woesearchaeota archaeon]MBW3021630.1 hypothetical protein [Candidatus Woesearchaeota archaeon]
MHKKVGSYAFLVVLALAVIAGLVTGLLPITEPGTVAATTTVTWILVILGLIVGLLNITKKESESFLVASVALLLFSAALPGVLLVAPLKSVLDNIAAFVGPAALLVALKVIYELAEKK